MFLFNKYTTDMAQILQSPGYKECSIISPKFFITNSGTSAIMDQTASCYVVTTSEMGLQQYKIKQIASRFDRNVMSLHVNM